MKVGMWRLKLCELIGHRWIKPRWSEPNWYGERTTIQQCKRCGMVRMVRTTRVNP